MRPTRMTATGPSARSMLSVLFTEYVLPGSGTVKTSTLLEAMGVMGLLEPSTRQAIRRLSHDGVIERGGRGTWRLTKAGRQSLVQVRGRYSALTNERVQWTGEWLLVRTTVPEAQRALRHALRRDLASHGFGSLGQGWFITAKLDAEDLALDVLARLDIKENALTFKARSANFGTPEEIVASAWDFEELRIRYETLIEEFRGVSPRDKVGKFRAWTLFLQRSGWARSIDPQLPRELLPEHWVGDLATEILRERYARWQSAALAWWEEREPTK